jgi:transposase InsO family protein
MTNVTRIHLAWELRQVGQPIEYIAGRVSRDRSTIYRWLAGIRKRGIKGFIRHYQQAKKGRRVRKTHGYVEQRVLSLRRAYRNCCGQKIVYLLKQEGIKLSLSTVYRILNKHLSTLRKHVRTAKGQPARRGRQPREVIQMDTVELGAVYAFTAIDTYTKESAVGMRPGLTAQDGKQALEQIARRFGPVQTLQTDGGSEFEKDFADAVQLYAQEHVVARPYKKNDQAFIECFNGTLRREEFGRTPFKAEDLALAQQRADEFLAYYHTQRPHLALDMKTPAQFVAESHLP